MKAEQDNFEQNIARLVKLAGESEQPSKAFADSVIQRALDELRPPKAESEQKQSAKFVRVNWDRVMGWAAMIAVVYGAGFEILLSNVIKINPLFTATVVVAMFVNWLVYLGGFVL